MIVLAVALLANLLTIIVLLWGVTELVERCLKERVTLEDIEGKEPIGFEVDECDEVDYGEEPEDRRRRRR